MPLPRRLHHGTDKGKNKNGQGNFQKFPCPFFVLPMPGYICTTAAGLSVKKPAAVVRFYLTSTLRVDAAEVFTT